MGVLAVILKEVGIDLGYLYSLVRFPLPPSPIFIG